MGYGLMFKADRAVAAEEVAASSCLLLPTPGTRFPHLRKAEDKGTSAASEWGGFDGTLLPHSWKDVCPCLVCPAWGMAGPYLKISVKLSHWKGLKMYTFQYTNFGCRTIFLNDRSNICWMLQAIVLVPTETERISCLLGLAGIVVAAVTQNTSKESHYKMHQTK